MKKLCLICVLFLGACGSHHHDDDNAQSGTADAFESQVQNVVNTSSDESDPVFIDTFVATTPDDTEPVAVY